MPNKIKVKFSNRNEIRMGSPYMAADVQIEGLEIDLPTRVTFEDKYAISRDKSLLILVGFDLEKNDIDKVSRVINRWDTSSFEYRKNMCQKVNSVIK